MDRAKQKRTAPNALLIETPDVQTPAQNIEIETDNDNIPNHHSTNEQNSISNKKEPK